MKVKYWKSTNILSCFNINFELNLNILITKVEDESIVLYDPSDIVHFIDNSFLPATVLTSFDKYERMLKVFLYPSCIIQVENKVYVTIYGLKHFFSSLVISSFGEPKF